MKNVLMIVMIAIGFAVSAQAQTCKPADCTPCPPGCCIINCNPSKCSTSVASTKSDGNVNVVFASMTDAVNSGDTKMTKKEMKKCIAACKAEKTCTPSPACQVAPACKTGSPQSADVYHPAVQLMKN